MTRRVVVTGASGTLGRQLLPRLVAAGYDVRAVSRQPRAGADAVSWCVADLRAGTGLDAAVSRADVVVHCASAQRGDETAARKLIDVMQREHTAPHLVYISIVGVDRMPVGYYGSKLAVEQAIARSGVPYTILRATQFHDLLLRLFTTQRRLPVLLVPASARFQPIDTGEVADRLGQLAAAEPAGRVNDLGGPQVIEARDLARRYLQATGRRQAIVPVHVPGKIGRSLRCGAQLAPEHSDGRLTFENFLAAQSHS